MHRDDLADVRAKLKATGAEERHLFLGATMSSNWSLNYWLSEYCVDLPDRQPDLPEEITHLWIWSVVAGRRVLAWFPDLGWFDPSQNWATA